MSKILKLHFRSDTTQIREKGGYQGSLVLELLPAPRADELRVGVDVNRQTMYFKGTPKKMNKKIFKQMKPRTLKTILL